MRSASVLLILAIAFLIGLTYVSFLLDNITKLKAEVFELRNRLESAGSSVKSTDSGIIPGQHDEKYRDENDSRNFTQLLEATHTSFSPYPNVRLTWTDSDRRNAIHAIESYPSVKDLSEGQYIPTALCAKRKSCLKQTGRHKIHPNSTVREAQSSLFVNDKILSYDDIVQGYEAMNDIRGMFSTTTFMGVAMQQDPLDAIAIGDLLWRVRPRLFIELGTSGGGGALFFARLMLGYDPDARIITIDPASGGLAQTPLKNWNHNHIKRFCPWCTPAKDDVVWQKAVTFLRMLPTSEEALSIVRKAVEEVVAQGLPVMVMEDSNHLYKSVKSNLESYSGFVTPGSYFIVQDIRAGRFRQVVRAVDEFLRAQDYKADYKSTPVYVRDRRPEYFIFSQHSGGFLRRLEPGDQLHPFFDEPLYNSTSALEASSQKKKGPSS